MREGFPLTQSGAAGLSILVSWATISCTLTTDLDFVGPPLASSEVEPNTNQPDADDAGNGSSVDASISSASTIDIAPESSGEATSASMVESDSTHSDSRRDASVADARVLDASALDASQLDASIRDGALDGAMRDASPEDCIAATTLLAESYEGDLTKWSSVNWQSTPCHQTDIATDIAVESAHSVRSRIQCAADSDHLHFTSFQLLNTEQVPPTGQYAPYGFVLSFSAWLSVGYDFEADTWLDFVRFTGTCDRTDAPLAIGLNDPSRQLSITNATTLDELSPPETDAPSFPLAAWTAVDVYINYDEGSLVVWQDGALVTQATFASDATTLCHVEFGTMASMTHSDLVTFEDEVRLMLLQAPLFDVSVAPRVCRE